MSGNGVQRDGTFTAFDYIERIAPFAAHVLKNCLQCRLYPTLLRMCKFMCGQSKSFHACLLFRTRINFTSSQLSSVTIPSLKI